MNFAKHNLLSSCALVATLCAAGSALAQSTPAGGRPTAVQTNTTNLSEIVVTADKRPERVLDVPGAITAIRGPDLLNSGTNSIRDFAGLTPGLQFNNGLGSGAPIIRGLSEGIDTSPTVATVVNGAPIGSSSSLSIGAQDTLDLDPIDISQVEVLKGPQGTLYGANTLGGLISYTLIEPSLTRPQAIARAEVSDTEGGGVNYSLRGAVSGPLVADQLGIRVSGYYDQQSGFIDNSVRGLHDENRSFTWGAHGSILYQPTDRLKITLDGFYQSLKTDAGDVVVYNFTTHQPLQDLHYDQYILPSADKQIGAFVGNIEYDLGFATLTSVTSYQSINSDNVQNLAQSATVGTFVHVLPLFGGPSFPAPGAMQLDRVIDTTKETQELRLTSPSDRRLTWIVGGFFTHEDNNYNALFTGRDTSGNVVPTLDPALEESLLSSLTEYSGFINATYKIMPALDVTGGFRIGGIDQRYQQLLSGSDATAYNTLLVVAGLHPVPAVSTPATSSTTVETYLATLRYHFSPDSMLFARFATGFRPGGPNTVTPGLPATFNPDRTENFEVGLKSRFWDGRGTLEITGYDTRWRDIIVVVQSGGFAGYTNGGDADIKGVEGSLTLRPVPQLTLAATGAYSDSRVNSVTPAGVTALAVGDPLPYNPKFSGSLSAEYRAQIANDLTGYGSAVYRYSGARHAVFSSSQFAPDYVMPAYSLLDLHVGVEKGPYVVDLFVKNVTDERAQIAANTFFNLAEVTVARPRTFGIAITARY